MTAVRAQVDPSVQVVDFLYSAQTMAFRFTASLLEVGDLVGYVDSCTDSQLYVT